VTAETAEASEGRNVELQQNLEDDFYREPIDLTGRKTSAGGMQTCRPLSSEQCFHVALCPGLRLRPA